MGEERVRVDGWRASHRLKAAEAAASSLACPIARVPSTSWISSAGFTQALAHSIEPSVAPLVLIDFAIKCGVVFCEDSDSNEERDENAEHVDFD